MFPTSIATHLSEGRCYTFFHCRHGFCDKIAQVKRERLNPYCHQPRVYKGCNPGPLLRKYREPRNYGVIQRKGVFLNWNPKAIHLRQGYTFHFFSIQGTLSGFGSRTKSQYSLSFSDRWAIRKDESNYGRSAVCLLQSPTEWLGWLATGYAIYYQ